LDFISVFYQMAAVKTNRVHTIRTISQSWYFYVIIYHLW